MNLLLWLVVGFIALIIVAGILITFEVFLCDSDGDIMSNLIIKFVKTGGEILVLLWIGSTVCKLFGWGF